MTRRVLIIAIASVPFLQAQPAVRPAKVTVAELATAIRERARALENSQGMREGFRSFQNKFQLPAESVTYSDYAIARLLFEATRDPHFFRSR